MAEITAAGFLGTLKAPLEERGVPKLLALCSLISRPANLFRVHLLTFFSKHISTDTNLLPSGMKNVLLFSSYITNGRHCAHCVQGKMNVSHDELQLIATKYSRDKNEKILCSLLPSSSKIIPK